MRMLNSGLPLRHFYKYFKYQDFREYLRTSFVAEICINFYSPTQTFIPRGV